MHSDMQTDAWSVMYQNPQFHAIARKRKLVVMTLFVVSALFYFSIPFITTFYPRIFHVQLFGAVNLGLVYAVLQYPLGGLVAYAYAVHMRKLDQEVTRL
ncbi:MULTISPECIES: DUF485 domain-containing protein [Herbaspirillum]|uniref:DUF485 domain-containing protein n=1 Tax=Herbaspirillum TaxID=963 RepID=UPI00073A27CD|nr:DUF485 domain-containing protein [Herbaspirillum rubrisubalbicans]